MNKYKNVLMICVLMLMSVLISCGSAVVGPVPPPEPEYVEVVEVEYQRYFGDSDVCPPLNSGIPFHENTAYISGLTKASTNPKMEVREKDYFYKKLEKADYRIKVNYPYETWEGDPYKVSITDSLWFNELVGGDGAYFRGRFITINGKRMERIHGDCSKDGEYILIRLDKQGNAYEVDK